MNCRHKFALYLGGAEAPSWHKVLRETEGCHIGLGFMALRARLPKNKPYLLKERFDERFEILVDSGGFNADRREDFDHKDHMLRYVDWVSDNIDRISLVTEYDVVSLGLDWANQWRDQFWSTIDPDKFVPIWHEEYGAAELDRLCDTYPRVGVVKPSNSNIESRLINLAARTGVKLHGVGITSPDLLAKVPFASVASTSWISPSKNGEFHCWSQNKLHWFPQASSKQNRKLHRRDIEQAGFDPDAIEIGQNSEVNHYSAWAWRQWEKQLLERAETRFPGTGVEQEADIVDISGLVEKDEVDNTAPQERRNLPAVPRERRTLPGLVIKTQEVPDEQGNGTRTVNVPSLAEDLLRVCNTCSLQNVCPEFQRDAQCAFRVPVQLRTFDQLKGWAQTLLEIQMRRVMTLQMSEEMQGGAPDAALSQELDRMSKLQLQYKELLSDEFSLELKVKAPGQAGQGIFSQLFGKEAGETSYNANQAIDPVRAESVVQSFIDVEAIDD